MSREPAWARQQRLAREAEEHVAFNAQLGSMLGLDEEPDTDSPDCPNCGAKVAGRWAVITTCYASYSGPEERDPFCWHCVPWVYRKRLAEALEEHRSED